MSSLHPTLKRLAAWTAAVILVATGYLASAPFVAKWCDQHFPSAIPVVRVVWTPVWSWLGHSEWPGSRAYGKYYSWGQRMMKQPVDTRAILGRSTDLEFNNAALRDVMTYVSEIHDCRIDIDGDVDPDRRVSIRASGTLADALDELFKPEGLVAAPVGDRIVIGTPEVVQRLAREFDRQKLIRNAITLGILFLCLALTIWFIRRRFSHRQPAAAPPSA